MTIDFFGPIGCVIVECHELEKEHTEHGRDVRYIGIMKFYERVFGIFRRHTSTYHFYVDCNMNCYDFEDSLRMPKTTEAFKEFMARRVSTKTQDKFLLLLESAKRIS